MEHLWALLNGKIKMIPGLEWSFNGAPFSLPILVENRDVVQKQLAQKGVYAPVLWPIDEKARKTCEVLLMFQTICYLFRLTKDITMMTLRI